MKKIILSPVPSGRVPGTEDVAKEAHAEQASERKAVKNARV